MIHRSSKVYIPKKLRFITQENGIIEALHFFCRFLFLLCKSWKLSLVCWFDWFGVFGGSPLADGDSLPICYYSAMYLKLSEWVKLQKWKQKWISLTFSFHPWNSNFGIQESHRFQLIVFEAWPLLGSFGFTVVASHDVTEFISRTKSWMWLGVLKWRIFLLRVFWMVFLSRVFDLKWKRWQRMKVDLGQSRLVGR